MCGSVNWQDEGWKPFAVLPGDLAAGVAEAGADEEASAPLQREQEEVAASSVLPRSVGELLRE